VAPLTFFPRRLGRKRKIQGRLTGSQKEKKKKEVNPIPFRITCPNGGKKKKTGDISMSPGGGRKKEEKHAFALHLSGLRASTKEKKVKSLPIQSGRPRGKRSLGVFLLTPPLGGRGSGPFRAYRGKKEEGEGPHLTPSSSHILSRSYIAKKQGSACPRKGGRKKKKKKGRRALSFRMPGPEKEGKKNKARELATRRRSDPAGLFLPFEGVQGSPLKKKNALTFFCFAFHLR